MSLVAKPHTFSDSGGVVASQFNENYDAIYNDYNGNIDNSNIKVGANIEGSKLLAASVTSTQLAALAITDAKLDYTSAKVLRTGPNISGNGLRIARGGKAYTLVAGVVGVTITFSSDSDDGNPAFSASPRITFGNEHASSAATYSVVITAISAASFTVEIRCSNGADATSGTLHWTAVGAA